MFSVVEDDIWLFILRAVSFGGAARGAQARHCRNWQAVSLHTSKSFQEIRDLQVNSTSITNKHFQQILQSVLCLESLDISNCPYLDKTAIFKARYHMGELQHVKRAGLRKACTEGEKKEEYGRQQKDRDCGTEEDENISQNTRFSILAVTCLCFCPNLHMMVMHGIHLNAKKLLLLEKTFETISCGDLEIETKEGFPLRHMMGFQQELFAD